MKKAADAVVELDGMGLSLIEISHRSKEFVSIMETARSLTLDLLGLENKGYQVLFLQGGASMQFLMVAFNLLENKAGYVNTGAWSSKAIKEANLLGKTEVVASSEDKGFTYILKRIPYLKIWTTCILPQITLFTVRNYGNCRKLQYPWSVI